MKLLLITAIKEFESEIKQILKHSGVKSFSVQPVKGYKNNPESKLDNWFGTDDVGIESLLFTVFVDCECVDEIYIKANEFNMKQESLSHIHVTTVALEKFN